MAAVVPGNRGLSRHRGVRGGSTVSRGLPRWRAEEAMKTTCCRMMGALVAAGVLAPAAAGESVVAAPAGRQS